MRTIYFLFLAISLAPLYSLAQDEPSALSGIQYVEDQPELIFDVNDESLELAPFLPIPMQFSPPPPLRIEGSEIDYAYGAFQRGFYQTALQLATEEALQGDHAAQALLGELYQSGLAVPRDLVKAREWYEIASHNGNVQAMFQLGLFYSEGIGGLPKDLEQAYRYFKAASDAGNLVASLNLGLYYLVGDAIPRDLDKAINLIESVANKGFPDAQYILGVALFDGEFGLPNKKLGMSWLKKAAESDHVAAQVRYGINRYQGVGTDIDKQDGAQWLLKAANAGNPIAMNRVAKIYRIGEGLEFDVIEAAKWHIISQHWEGIPDIDLEQFVVSLSDEEREEANKRVDEWIF